MATRRGWVVDASVILKWSLRDEQFTREADALKEAFLSNAVDLVAPSFSRYEVANGLEAARVQGRVDARSAQARFRMFLETGLGAYEDDGALLTEAMRFARELSIALYDAVYVALADRLRFSFITADRRLYDRLAASGAPADWIGDLPALP